MPRCLCVYVCQNVASSTFLQALSRLASVCESAIKYRDCQCKPRVHTTPLNLWLFNQTHPFRTHLLKLETCGTMENLNREFSDSRRI